MFDGLHDSHQRYIVTRRTSVGKKNNKTKHGNKKKTRKALEYHSKNEVSASVSFITYTV